MQNIAQQGNCPIWLVEMQQDSQFCSPCPGEEFAALVAVYDNAVTNENRNALCSALVAQGCRNGVFWGHDCSGWDDALNWAYLAAQADSSITDSRLVMSSWYDDEPLTDAIFGLLKCSAFDDFSPHNFVVIAVGTEAYDEIFAAIESEITLPEVSSALPPSTTQSALR